MSYKITWEPKGVIWTFHDTLTGQEAIEASMSIYGDPRFDDLRYGIIDISKVEQFKIADEALETAAAMDEAATLTNPRLVVAVVAAGKDAVAVGEVYKSAMSETSWKVEIFDTMNEAEEWTRHSCDE